MLYTPAVEWCSTYSRAESFDEPDRFGIFRLIGGGAIGDPYDDARGWLTAVDASTGAIRWNYQSPQPMLASITTTSGGLLITGELTGDFVIFDAADGAELYRFNTGAPINGERPAFLEELSGASERPMIIPMTITARPQQRYDHRLRNLVHHTGDVTIATDLGVPRATARGPGARRGETSRRAHQRRQRGRRREGAVRTGRHERDAFLRRRGVAIPVVGASGSRVGVPARSGVSHRG